MLLLSYLRRLILRAWYRLFPVPESLPRGERIVIHAHRVISLLGDDMSELETKLLEKIAEIVAAEDLKKVAYAELVSDSEAEDAAEAALAEASEERAASQDVYADADEVFDGKLAELIALADAAKV